MDGRNEITPCVLQDIGPLRPLPKKQKKMREIVKERERDRKRERERDREIERERVKVEKKDGKQALAKELISNKRGNNEDEWIILGLNVILFL